MPLNEEQSKIMESLVAGSHNAPSFRRMALDNFKKQAEKDPRFGEKLEALAAYGIDLKVASARTDVGVSAGRNYYTVGMDPRELKSDTPVIDKVISGIIRAESQNPTRSNELLQNLRSVMKGPGPVVAVPSASASSKPAEEDHRHTTRRPGPVQDRFSSAARGDGYSSEIMENARSLHSEIRKLEAGGMPEFKARQQVMEQREQELKKSGLSSADARYFLNRELQAEREIDRAQDRSEKRENRNQRYGVPLSQSEPEQRVDQAFSYKPGLISDRMTSAARGADNIAAMTPEPAVTQAPAPEKEKPATRTTGPVFT